MVDSAAMAVGTRDELELMVEEFPELADYVEDLRNLSVCNATVLELDDVWKPIVVFHMAYDLEWCITAPWVLGDRPTQEAARGAIIELLTGLALLRRDVGRAWPWVEDPADNEPGTRHTARRSADAVIFETTRVIHKRMHQKLPPEPTPAELWGQQLRAARRAAGLTQHEVAERFELNQNAMSLLERGRRNSVRLSVVRAIALELGVPPPEDGEVDTSRQQ